MPTIQSTEGREHIFFLTPKGERLVEQLLRLL